MKNLGNMIWLNIIEFLKIPWIIAFNTTVEIDLIILITFILLIKFFACILITIKRLKFGFPNVYFFWISIY